MNYKNFLIATVLSFLFIWLAGFAWYALLMADWYAAHTGEAGNIGRAMPLMGFLSLGLFIQAAVMSYLYPKGYESGKPVVMQGLRFGIAIGLFIGLGFGFLWYATSIVVSMESIWMDTIFSLIQMGVAGIIIALAYGEINK